MQGEFKYLILLIKKMHTQHYQIYNIYIYNIYDVINYSVRYIVVLTIEIFISIQLKSLKSYINFPEKDYI